MSAIDAPTAGGLLIVSNHGNVFKAWQWPPKFNAHCRRIDDFKKIDHFVCFLQSELEAFGLW